MKNLLGLSRDEIGDEIQKMGEKAFRLKQLWHQIYFQGQFDFNQMTTLSKDFRQKLALNYEVRLPKIIHCQTASDQTTKWLIEFDDGQRVETVFIPEEDRGAICVSTQVGCAMKCAFCHTGTQKFIRNLTAAEIVAQVMVVVRHYNGFHRGPEENRLVSNIVFMGMGEPLYNYDALVQALDILMDSDGLCFSKRRITVSTCGRADYIPRLAQIGVKLAVSLHAPNDQVRNQIMPISKKFPMQDLIQACRLYQKNIEHRQYITIEYTLLKGLNDSEEQAHELAKLLKDLEVKVNLIPFNKWDGCPFEPSSRNQIYRFMRVLESYHIPAPIRVSRGDEIMAACGQLKSQFG